MIVIMVLLFKAFLTPRIVEAARRDEKGLQGRMEGPAALDMSVHEGTIWRRMTSEKGRTAISHFFVMDWVSLWIDIGAGLLIAGALAAWVPKHFWQAFFLQGHRHPGEVLGPCDVLTFGSLRYPHQLLGETVSVRSQRYRQPSILPSVTTDRFQFRM